MQMMKWGRKKPSSSASSISASSSSSSLSHPHSVSHVFPLSWFSRSKQMREKPASGIQKLNQKEKLQISRKITPKSNTKCSSSSSAYKSENSRLYTQDDDGFWRLSFDGHQKVAEDDQNGKISVPPRYCGNCKSNGKQPATRKRTQNSNKKHRDQEHSRGTPSQEEAKDQSLQRTNRRIIEATSELQRELGEVRDGCRKSVEREMQDFELHHAMHHVSARDSEKFHQKAEVEDEDSKETWQKLKEAKIREFLSKGEKQRKSFHLSRDNSQTRVSSSSRHGKLRIQSPRTPAKTETCKIKALENLKKLKMKNTKKKMMMMKMKEITIEDKAAKMESFAVVKSSCDPQKDFRDSMLEMIMEKKIRRPQELEELLACYLTLNSDEYHDLIIKVFRQLWCELEESFFDQKSSEKYYYSNV